MRIDITRIVVANKKDGTFFHDYKYLGTYFVCSLKCHRLQIEKIHIGFSRQE